MNDPKYVRLFQQYLDLYNTFQVQDTSAFQSKEVRQVLKNSLEILFLKIIDRLQKIEKLELVQIVNNNLNSLYMIYDDLNITIPPELKLKFDDAIRDKLARLQEKNALLSAKRRELQERRMSDMSKGISPKNPSRSAPKGSKRGKRPMGSESLSKAEVAKRAKEKKAEQNRLYSEKRRKEVAIKAAIKDEEIREGGPRHDILYQLNKNLKKLKNPENYEKDIPGALPLAIRSRMGPHAS